MAPQQAKQSGRRLRNPRAELWEGQVGGSWDPALPSACWEDAQLPAPGPPAALYSLKGSDVANCICSGFIPLALKRQQRA